ncbi:MAG TPA: phosphodiester glycosidase family protein [Longimicrobium sp.]|jgi:uncharacterized protein YigE (DUF2233 family)
MLSVVATACAAQEQGRRAVEYREMRSGGGRYQVVRVDLARADLRLYWRDEAGRPFGSLAALDRWLAARGDTLLAATNAGIFYRSRLPAGLHVERGRTLRPLNRSAEPPAGELRGNFFYQPNGVFSIAADGTARIVETGRAGALLPRMREATQSGPLLLRAGSPHWLVGQKVSRNAVAVCSPREVALVYAPDGVTVRQLALFVRDVLGCRDALYLDGTISGLRVPSADVDADGSYVGILGVTPRRR